jgi:hypothetical protein
MIQQNDTNYPNPEAKSKRLQELTNWLKEFQALIEEKGKHISYVDEDVEKVAERLNDWYWLRRKTDVEPYMIPEENEVNIRINQYKIISGLELAVIGFQPLKHDNDSKRSILNAELAWFIGLTVLIEWNNLDREKVYEVIKKNRIDRFITEHTSWLAKLDIQLSYPIFSNSHTWWNFHACLDLYLGNEQPLQMKIIQ